MRTLFVTGSPASYMRPPVLGEEQINCGPDWPDQQSDDGRILSLATPLGEYDLATLARRLPKEQWPDVVVCLVDASWRSKPRNLQAFKCPRVLLVADTHHMPSPLGTMLGYVLSEPFDRVVLLYDRHHADFFQTAGVENLYWYPGLTFPHSDAVVRQARQNQRTTQLAFVGQVGRFHPRRTRVLAALTEAGLPLNATELSQTEGLAHYGASLVGLNASLNGDLNLRIFEVLACGAALLTDTLAPSAGLADLFQGNQGLTTYASLNQLVEQAQWLLDHPAETKAKGQAGQNWFDTYFDEKRRRSTFQSLAVDGIAAPEFLLPARTSPPSSSSSSPTFSRSVVVYQMVQELHRTMETVRVSLTQEPPGFAAMCTTLPRVVLVQPPDAAELAVVSMASTKATKTAGAPLVWCWDAGAQDISTLQSTLGRAGYFPLNPQLGLFSNQPTTQPAGNSKADKGRVPDAKSLVDRGAEALLAGDSHQAAALAEEALAASPTHAEARVLMGRALVEQGYVERGLSFFLAALPDLQHDARLWLLLAQGLCATKQWSDSYKAVRKSLDLDSDNPETWLVLGIVARHFGNDDIVAKVIAVLRRASPPDPRIAALLTAKDTPKTLTDGLDRALRLLQVQQSVEAESVLTDVESTHPGDPRTPYLLGHALKQQGRLEQALTLHRRALTATPHTRDASRKRRVAFLIQHPPVWSSTKTVVEAFRRDSSWETLVIAAPYLHPYASEREQQSIFAFLDQDKTPYIPWDTFSFQPGFADAVFLQNPYDVTRPPGLGAHDLLRSVQRLIYIPYGIEIGGGDVNHEYQFNLPLQQVAWLICARSKRHRAMFGRHCLAGNAHVVVTGHPKLDALLQHATPEGYNPYLSLAAGRKIVVWNPQFDVTPDGSGFSTFQLYCDSIPAAATQHKNILLVIRPHPLLFGTLVKRGLWSDQDIEAWRGRVAGLPNVVFDTAQSYVPLFQASAAMLSDASSFLLEYSALGNPLLYLHNAGGPGLNDDGKFVLEHCYVACARDDIASFLAMVAAGEDPKQAARLTSYPDYMLAPEEGAGERVKRTVEQRMAWELH
jgi:cytochrome c-type biogenesis protein CcmH/NrfG